MSARLSRPVLVRRTLVAAACLTLLGPLAPGRLQAGPTWAACARIDAPAVDECSGIVESRRFPGVLWVHNDSGDRARFFAVDVRGKLLTEVAVTGAQNVDWEDIAVDDSGRVYLGDFGNNRNKRRDLVVYVVDEPDPRQGPASIRVMAKRRIPFHYPDQNAFPDSNHFNFDCEAMFWRAGNLYLLTKHRSDLRTTLYRLDPWHAGEQTAVRLGEAEMGSPVTGADCSRDGKQVVVLSYQFLHVFEWPATGEDFLAGRSHAMLIEGRQCEGVCFDAQRVLFTNEQREIYCLSARSLWSQERYVPDPPRVVAPHVEARLDGSPGEWPADRKRGRLAFGRFVQADEDAASGATPESRSAERAAADSARVRVGWCAKGVLVHASWVVQDWEAEARDGRPIAWFMVGPPGENRNCLEPSQLVWSATPASDSLTLSIADPEPGQPRCGISRLAMPSAKVATRRRGARVDLEVLLPVPATALVPDGEVLLDVVLEATSGGRRTEVAWSASLDMQPLGNPLLWGRVRLAPPRGRPGGH